MSEKATKDSLLPSEFPSGQQKSNRTKAVRLVILLGLFALAQYFWTSSSTAFNVPPFANKDLQGLCPQAAELTPQKNEKVWKLLNKSFSTGDFKIRAIDWLGGAVRVPRVLALLLGLQIAYAVCHT